MPTPKRTVERIEGVIQAATLQLNKVVGNTQGIIYNLIISELRNLETDSDGYILQTAANRKTIRGISKIFDAGLAKSGYVQGLSDFISTINGIDSINAEYFQAINEGFTGNTTLIKSIQKQSIAEIESLLLNDGLESQIKQPLLNLLNQNVNTGGIYSGMVDQVKGYVKGIGDTDGKLLRYTKQIAQDALNNYSRAYQTSIGEALGLVFYQFVGGIMPESRDFCRDRVNGYFHYKEIESWAKLSWPGKRSDTTESSIFIYAGGYNCEHQMIPVSNTIVPESELKRAKDLGFYRS